MSKRALSDWLDAYLEYTSRTEPPTSYHTWVGISTLAGALQRRVHLKWGLEVIYPNLYIILVGASGKTRKGTALAIGKDLLQNTSGIVMASESITKEALIRLMKSSVQNYLLPSREVRFHCSVTCMSEELSVFLGQGDIKFLASLTDWYDSKDSWTYETKNSGTDAIKGMCFNFLGATAPDWLQSMLPQEAVGGGFTSRVIFVVEERKKQTVPEHILSPREVQLGTALTSDLERIVHLSGEIKFSPEGKQSYIDWYTEEDAKLQRGELPVADNRFANYAERRSTHIRKLCMVLSASRSDDLLITAEDFSRAVDILKSAELKMYKTFGGLGQAQYGQITEKVMNTIQERRNISLSQLMGLYHRDMDMGVLKIVEEVLLAMKVVEIVRDLKKGEVLYRWIGEPKK